LTERKQAEHDLKDTEAKFQALVEQSIAGTYIIQDGKFSYVNPRFREILGYMDDDSLHGKDALHIVAEKDQRDFQKQMEKLENAHGNTPNFLFSALRKDGSEVGVGITCTLATYQNRPAIIGMLQDISDSKVAEQQIQRYTEQLQRTFLQTVNLVTTLSEMRDPYTAGHERRVADISVAIGSEMGLNDHQLEGLRIGGYLHDVGKTLIPIDILVKPGKISSMEYELVKLHPQAGYDILKNVDFPWPVAQMALQHHERMDGSGYPNGLKGEEILLEARIMAVADVVEAMSSHRPYRPALGIDQALAEIERGRGTAYDPVAVDACLDLFRNKGYMMPS
jgi:PAS domain S-box-containing protein